MALTAQQLVNLTMHALGNRALRTSHDIWQTVNRAGHAFIGCWGWPFAKGQSVIVSGVANKEYIDLPPDFGSVTECVSTTAGSAVTLTTREEIDRLRRDGGASFTQYVAEGYRIPAQTSHAPVPCLYLWPIPSADGSPELSLTCSSTWRELSASNPDASVGVPADAEQALIDCCFQLALHVEDAPEQPSPDVVSFPAVQALVRRYAGRQVFRGPMRGGADSLNLSRDWRPPRITSISSS